MKKSKPILITTLGFPGSGKTHFSERLAAAKNFVHINADRTRFTLNPIPTFTREETVGVFKLMDYFTEEFLQHGISVIYDANANFRAHRKRIADIAKKTGSIHRLVWIKTDVEVAEKRLVKRATIKNKKKQLIYRPLDISILHKLKDEIEQPSPSERSIVIDGHASFTQQLKTLEKELFK